MSVNFYYSEKCENIQSKCYESGHVSSLSQVWRHIILRESGVLFVSTKSESALISHQFHISFGPISILLTAENIHCSG